MLPVADVLERVPLLIASIAALMAGPALHALAKRSKIGRLLFRYGVIIAIAYLILAHVLPEAGEVCGDVVAWSLLLVGIALPFVVEKAGARSVMSHGVALGLAAFGLFLHAMTDGVALGIDPEAIAEAAHHGHHHHHHDHEAIGYAVVLHRLPVGAAIYGLLLEHGRKTALAAFGGIVVATMLGFFVGAPWLEVAGATPVAAFQAFAGGVLMHVLLHDHGDHNDHDGGCDDSCGHTHT